MSDLGRWGQVSTGSFQFGPKPDTVDPWQVIVRRPIIDVSPSGPIHTGKTIVTRRLNGEIVERWVEDCEPHPLETPG